MTKKKGTKAMKKLSLFLALLLCVLAVSACGGEKAEENKFTYSLTDIKTKCENDFDFNGGYFFLNTDEFSEDILMYQYGVEDEEVIESIDSYLLSTPGTNSAKTLAVIIFKDGTSKETMTKAETAIREVYLASVINNVGLYDPAQAPVAEKAEFTYYDNALVLVAYDAEGNTALTSEIFK